MSIELPWFLEWLCRHQAWNHHNGWAAYERPGPLLVYRPWFKAFRSRAVTEAEADAASEAMAATESSFPEHHLPRLLEIMASARAARAAEREKGRAEAEDEQARADQAAYDEARVRWLALPDNDRESRLASALSRYPDLVRLPKLIERIAIDEMRGRPHPPAVPGAGPTVSTPAAKPSAPAEEPPTPGQLAMLAHLPRWAKVRLETFSHDRRRGILAHYEHGFDRVKLPATITDIADGAGKPKPTTRPTEAGARAPADEAKAIDLGGEGEPDAQAEAIEEPRADRTVPQGEALPAGPPAKSPARPRPTRRERAPLIGQARGTTTRAGKSRRAGSGRGRAPPSLSRSRQRHSSPEHAGDRRERDAAGRESVDLRKFRKRGAAPEHYFRLRAISGGYRR